MKIAIIKLGAKGDVVRTLHLLPAIKEKYPESEITWITKEHNSSIVRKSPYLNEVLTLNQEISDNFDLLINLDIEEEATQLADKIQADNKLGFKSDEGFVSSYNLPSEYYLSTLFDDEIKKTNKKTYQEMMFEAAEIDYNKQFHPIELTNEEKEYGINFFKKNKISKEKLLGIHLGASPRWPSKAWHKEKVEEFIKKAIEKEYNILLFGGPDEIGTLEKFKEELKDKNIDILTNNPHNTDLEFVSLVDQCTIMICGDSFSLHVSTVLKKPTIGLFFCTPSNEVEPYNIIKKITSSLLYDFFPEKMDQYDEDLVKSISPEQVLEKIEEIEAKN